jgi:four helix bundle protein
MELETHLILAKRLSYIKENQLNMLQQEVETLGRRINSLIHSLLRK